MMGLWEKRVRNGKGTVGLTRPGGRTKRTTVVVGRNGRACAGKEGMGWGCGQTRKGSTRVCIQEI